MSRLPLRLTWEVAGVQFQVLHATPRDPLYDYRLVPHAPDSLLDETLEGTRADVLIAGHTHLPFVRGHRGVMLVNPGSVGQPLDGDPRAAYAIWEDGHITLCRTDYDVTTCIVTLSNLPLAPSIRDQLIATIRNGRVPQQ